MNQATPFPIEDLARAVASQIAARGGPQPTISVRQPAPSTAPAATAGAAASSIGGEIIIEIKYSTTVYGVMVAAPSTDFNAWLFKLTMQKSGEVTPVNIAFFEFVDAANWKVAVNTPPIPITDSLSIERIFVSLLDGTVPPYPPPPSH